MTEKKKEKILQCYRHACFTESSKLGVKDLSRAKIHIVGETIRIIRAIQGPGNGSERIEAHRERTKGPKLKDIKIE